MDKNELMAHMESAVANANSHSQEIREIMWAAYKEKRLLSTADVERLKLLEKAHTQEMDLAADFSRQFKAVQ